MDSPINYVYQRHDQEGVHYCWDVPGAFIDIMSTPEIQAPFQAYLGTLENQCLYELRTYPIRNEEPPEIRATGSFKPLTAQEMFMLYAMIAFSK